MERAAEAEMSPSVWVTGYVDQSRKCGFGFLLSDQSVSVGFNDGTSMVLEPTGVAFDYINRTRPSSMAEAGADKREETIRTRHTIKDFPLELKRKVHLLKDFRSYVHKLAKCKEGKALGRVDGGRSSTTSAQQHGGTVGEPLMFVEQFRRTPQMILFRLSNRTVQVRVCVCLPACHVVCSVTSRREAVACAALHHCCQDMVLQ